MEDCIISNWAGLCGKRIQLFSSWNAGRCVGARMCSRRWPAAPGRHPVHRAYPTSPLLDADADNPCPAHSTPPLTGSLSTAPFRHTTDNTRETYKGYTGIAAYYALTQDFWRFNDIDGNTYSPRDSLATGARMSHGL